MNKDARTSAPVQLSEFGTPTPGAGLPKPLRMVFIAVMCSMVLLAVLMAAPVVIHSMQPWNDRYRPELVEAVKDGSLIGMSRSAFEQQFGQGWESTREGWDCVWRLGRGESPLAPSSMYLIADFENGAVARVEIFED